LLPAALGSRRRSNPRKSVAQFAIVTVLYLGRGKSGRYLLLDDRHARFPQRLDAWAAD
jgi:hypothetical protein